jgi:hypothetical protein
VVARAVEIEASLDRLAGSASRLGWSVRGLSKWSDNTRCGTAAAAFAARVDLDKLMDGTTFAMEVGQSPFMITRGKMVERLVRENGYAQLIPILREELGFASDEVAARDLRQGFPPNTEGFVRRATATRHVLESILAGDPNAPNIVEGAVLEAQLGPYTARFEADAIGARLGPILHGLEVKSWPVVDGRADDPGKASEALRQLGFYLLLLKRLVDELGADSDIVSPEGLLVTPKNVGLTLVGSTRDLRREVALADATLGRLPDASDFVAFGGLDTGFGDASPNSGFGADERLENLETVVDTFGTHYQASCLSSCGMAKFCRARLHAAGDPAVCGSATVRFLPGVRTLGRAADLAAGAPATREEEATGVAAVASSAGSLYEDRLPPNPLGEAVVA